MLELCTSGKSKAPKMEGLFHALLLRYTGFCWLSYVVDELKVMFMCFSMLCGGVVNV